MRTPIETILADANDYIDGVVDTLIILGMALGNRSGGLTPAESDAVHAMVAHASGLADNARDDVVRVRDLMQGSS